MPWQVFYKMYRPPISSLLWYFLHCETWVSQIFAPNIPKTSTTRLRVETWLSGATWHQNSPLQRQNVKRPPCDTENPDPETKFTLVNAPCDVRVTQPKITKRRNYRKKHHTKNHKYYMNFWYTKFTLVTALCDVGVTKPGEPLDAFFAARFPFTFVG